MSKTIGIFGTSGFARETADIAYEVGFAPIFIARDQGERDAWDFSDDIILESEVERFKDMAFTIGIGENAIRQKVALRFTNKLRFTNLVHPSATFGKRQREHIESKSGVIVCAGVRFTNNIVVGDFSIFNLNSTVGHDVIIEEFVNIAPGANISGNVHIETRCWVGTGATINQGSIDTKLCIGADTTIGSGSVVVKSCDPNAVYVGITAKRIK